MSDADSPRPLEDSPTDPQGDATHEADAAPRPATGGRLKALLRRWLLALPVGLLLAAVAVAAMWYWLPPGKYLAYVRLHMPTRAPRILYDIDRGEDFASFQREQLALLSSHRVLDKALSNPAVRSLPPAAGTTTLSAVDRLRNDVKVEFPDGPELPRVTMLGDDPAAPKVLVTAVVDAYLEEMSANQQAHQQKRIDTLKQILATYDERLQRLQKTKNELARAAGARNDKILVLQQDLLQKQLARAKSELIDVTADLRRWELEAQLFQQTQAPAEVPEQLIDAQIEKELEKEIDLRNKTEARLAQAKQLHDDPEHPTLKKYREELEAKTKFIDAQRKDPRVRERVKAEVLARVAPDGKTNSALLKDKIAFNKQLAKLLEAEVERMQLEVRDLNNKAIDLDSGKIDLRQAEAGVALVKSELDKAMVELPAPERVRRYDDEAIVVFLDDTPRKLRLAILAGLGAFATVLLVASFLQLPGGWGHNTVEAAQGDEALRHGDHAPAPDAIGGTLIHPSEG
jgi:hypothetical protein